MSFKLTTRLHNDILIATPTGDRNLETIVGIVEEIERLAKQHRKIKVLVDVRDLKGNLSVFKIFDLVTGCFKNLRENRVIRKGAILDDNLSYSRHIFLENVAVNRGYNFRVYENLDEALEWLKTPEIVDLKV